MKILFLSYFVRHIQEYWEPMILSLGGIDPLYICHNVLDQDYPGKSRDLIAGDKYIHFPHWGNSADEMVDLVQTFEPDLICIWNGELPVYKNVLEEIRAWVDLPVLYWELGWFPQKESIWADPKGINGGSALARMSDEDLLRLPPNFDKLARKKERYHTQVESRYINEPYLFVPLQVEDDSNILAYSPIKRMEEFVKLIERELPGRRLVIRPHPLDKTILSSDRSENSIVTSDGKLETWLAHADAVLGINSTVLMEALLFHKAVGMLGQSILSNKNIVCEEMPLKALLDFKPDGDRIDQVLSRLVNMELDYRKLNWESLLSSPLIGTYFKSND